MLVAVADVAVPFLSFLHSSVAAFLLFIDFRSTFDNFMLLLSVLCQIFQVIKGDTFSVSLKYFFWLPLERLP